MFFFHYRKGVLFQPKTLVSLNVCDCDVAINDIYMVIKDQSIPDVIADVDGQCE